MGYPFRTFTNINAKPNYVNNVLLRLPGVASHIRLVAG